MLSIANPSIATIFIGWLLFWIVFGEACASVAIRQTHFECCIELNPASPDSRKDITSCSIVLNKYLSPPLSPSLRLSPSLPLSLSLSSTPCCATSVNSSTGTATRQSESRAGLEWLGCAALWTCLQLKEYQHCCQPHTGCSLWTLCYFKNRLKGAQTRGVQTKERKIIIISTTSFK